MIYTNRKQQTLPPPPTLITKSAFRYTSSPESTHLQGLPGGKPKRFDQGFLVVPYLVVVNAHHGVVSPLGPHLLAGGVNGSPAARGDGFRVTEVVVKGFHAEAVAGLFGVTEKARPKKICKQNKMG